MNDRSNQMYTSDIQKLRNIPMWYTKLLWKVTQNVTLLHNQWYRHTNTRAIHSNTIFAAGNSWGFPMLVKL